MTKISMSYSFGNLSDAIEREAKKAIANKGVDCECPHCGYSFHAGVGLNRCPKCMKTVEVKFA